MTSASDLVPVSVLMNIARRVRQKAAEIARSKNVPIKSANEIGISAPSVTQGQISINLTLSDKLSAFEWGSGIHRRRGTPSKYPITPKNTRALVFPGTHEFEGQTIITKLVMHPGIEPRSFLGPAKRQTRRQNLEDIRKENLASTRLIIKGMSRKV